jgi:hypothetical protein
VGERLTEAELAERAGTSVARIRELTELGILEPEDGTFPRRDVMRARVVADLDAKGIGAEALARALASGHLRLGYLESAGRRFPRSERTFTQLAEGMGIPVETLEMLYVSLGLPRPEPDELVREEDLPILEGLPVLFSAGVGEAGAARDARLGHSAGASRSSKPLSATIEEASDAADSRTTRRSEPRSARSGRMAAGEQTAGCSAAEVFFVEHTVRSVETARRRASGGRAA